MWGDIVWRSETGSAVHSLDRMEFGHRDEFTEREMDGCQGFFGTRIIAMVRPRKWSPRVLLIASMRMGVIAPYGNHTEMKERI